MHILHVITLDFPSQKSAFPQSTPPIRWLKVLFYYFFSYPPWEVLSVLSALITVYIMKTQNPRSLPLTIYNHRICFHCVLFLSSSILEILFPFLLLYFLVLISSDSWASLTTNDFQQSKSLLRAIICHLRPVSISTNNGAYDPRSSRRCSQHAPKCSVTT